MEQQRTEDRLERVEQIADLVEICRELITQTKAAIARADSLADEVKLVREQTARLFVAVEGHHRILEVITAGAVPVEPMPSRAVH